MLILSDTSDFLNLIDASSGVTLDDTNPAFGGASDTGWSVEKVEKIVGAAKDWHPLGPSRLVRVGGS